jgi:hypothetical protein
MKWFRSKRGLVISSLIVLLTLFSTRPGANQLRARIVRSISLALGRPVEVSSVHIRLLPRPGFDLENFVVYDDAAFGAEPMLRAGDVTAILRLRSLLRGRLEIVRLSLTEPSLNLVRNPQGHWNLERLLERSAQIQVAPTSKSFSARRPGFPYIEASRGRINLKLGAEKTPYTLTDADFSIWQDSENTWSTRLQAEAVRTDFNLTDTGVIRIDGSWQRASSLRETPLNFTLLWERAQLGQLSKLAYGNDWGWRGALKVFAALSGTPADLTVKTDLSADEFHRYDILGGSSLRLAAHCNAHYSSMDKTFTGIACQAAGPSGAISLTGMASNPFESRSFDFGINIQGMPVQSLVNLVHHVTRGLPNDLTADGQVDAKLSIRRDTTGNSNTILWTGAGEISDLHLASRRANTDLELHSIPFALASHADSQSKATSRSGFAHKDNPPSEPHLEVGPLRVALGRPTPGLARGWIARSGYNFELEGEAQVQRLLQVARMVGIPALPAKADGVAKVDLQFAGDWSGQSAPKAMGKSELHWVRAQMRGWNAPLEIASADLNLLPDQVDVKNVTATIAGTAWHGSLAIPRPCGFTAECPIHFELHADEIALDRLNQLLNPSAPQQPWYHFLSSTEPAARPYLLAANATGKVSANRVVVGALTATQFSAKLELKNSRMQLSEIRAEVLGGRHTGGWLADFTVTPPRYDGNGSLERVSLRQLAALMHDDWITGSANTTYRASCSGLNKAELHSSASGTLRVEAWDGMLPHILLSDNASPLQINHLVARMLLQNQELEIQDGRLTSPDFEYQLKGTASFGRVLNLNLAREGALGFSITGTVAEPRVSEVAPSETRAALKP